MAEFFATIAGNRFFFSGREEEKYICQGWLPLTLPYLHLRLEANTRLPIDLTYHQIHELQDILSRGTASVNDKIGMFG